MGKDFISIANVELSDDEIQAVVEVLKSGRLRQGEKTREFEEKFAEKVGSKYAIAVSSGTAALHIAYLLLLEEGDEVLVPSFSHISTASMICFAKCKPIFCDLDSRTFTLDLESARKRLTDRTRAAVPVHLFGNACDMDGVISFARGHDLKIIWDAAQAHGTKYKGRDVGGFDDLVCYSFYPTKNMTTGEGGMITTNDSDLYERCKLLRSHGQTKKYYHPTLGLNYRMTDIEAAIGIEQLKKLDEFVRKRRQNAEYLTRGLSEIEGILPPSVEENVEHSYHQYTILLDLDKLGCTRDEFVEVLGEEGIGAGVHYPRPLHKQPVFENMLGDVSLPVSEDISRRILSLPVYPGLSEQDLEKIVRGVERAVSRCRG